MPRWVIWIGLALVLVGVVAVAALSRSGSLGDSGTKLPIRAKVPDFSLTERDGRTVTLESLRGHVWVADFIFTTCAGPCPELTLRMRSLQQAIAEFDGRVKLVSFSVDPTYDQPPVLRAYAKRYQADPNLWWFLTCDSDAEMHELVQKGFLQAVAPAEDGSPIIHSTWFVVVDAEGRIRVWYDGLEAASKPLILRDIAKLLAESTG